MRLKVLHTTHPTPDSVSLEFEKPSTDFAYYPGQHAVLSFNINGINVTRTYSFSSAPGIDAHLTITLKAVKDGLVSNYLVNNKINEIEMISVRGNFYLNPSAELKRHLVMFAGGSGITPMMSMIRSVLKKEPQSIISLIYTNKTSEHILFREDLLHLSNRLPERLRIFHVLTRQQNIPAGVPVYYKDRLSKLVLKKTIKNITNDYNGEREFYVCGPFGFMALVEDTLQSLSIDHTKIFKEHFYTPAIQSEDALISLPRQEIRVQFKDGEKLLEVGTGQSILQAAVQRGVRLAHSCTEGQCGVCRAVLISGEVKLRKNHVLTEDEINAGQILLCQGFPATGNVTVRPVNQP